MRGRRENIGNLNGDGGLGPAEGLLRWGGSDEEGGAGGGDGGDGVGGGGGGDVRSEKSNHNIFRPELCWPVTLAHSSVWCQIQRVVGGIHHLVGHPGAFVLC